MSDKYSRLVTFVVDICPRPLRELFIKQAKADAKPGVPYTSLYVYLQARKSDIDNLHRRGKIRHDQYALIYPPTGTVDENLWDISLLTTLLTSLFRGQLQKQDINCIDGIRDTRNKIQHISYTGNINNKDFNTYWSTLEYAVLQLSASTGGTVQSTIAVDIQSALTDSMPNLGNAMRTWYADKITDLEKKVETLQESLNQQTLQMKDMRADTTKTKNMISKASVKRKGRSGVPEKRMKIVNRNIERMRDRLENALKEEDNSINKTHAVDISLISQKLKDNNHVLVTGFDNNITYKCALAAIRTMEYEETETGLEVTNPSDWKQIGFEDARFVLFKEPFGVLNYDAHKAEVMFEELNSMLDVTNDVYNESMQIIMVANQRILSNVTRQYEHPMFDPASTVYIDSSPSDKSDPCDTDGIPAALHTILLKHALLCRQQYKVKPIPEQVRQKAEIIFTTNYTLAIVGPPQSGKTSIAFYLLSTYDLSEGEKNFLLLTDPGQVNYVDFDKKPVLIIKMGYPGFDKLEACHWYKKFDLLFAAVKDNKTAVIFTMDTETYKIWSADMPIHPILNHDFVVRVGKSSLEKIEGAGYSTKQCSVSKQDGLITVLKMAGNSMNHSENAWKEYPLGNFNEDEGNFNEDKGDLYFMATSTDKKLRKQIHKQDLKRKARHPLKRDEDEVFEKEKKNRVYQKQL